MDNWGDMPSLKCDGVDIMLAVTGITGHTGRFLIDELARAQYCGKIKCLVRTKSKADYLLKSGLNVEVIDGTLDSEKALEDLMKGVDTVVHIAGIKHSCDILRVGKLCNVRRFVLVHTTGIYSKFKAASNEYIKIEKAILPLMEEQNITIVRPTMIFGDICDYNVSKFIRFVDRMPILPIVGGGGSLVQPVNARDLAQGLFKILQTEKSCGKAYVLSGEKAITIRQLYRMIGKGLNKRRIIVGIPMWTCVLGARVIKACSNGRVDLVEKVQRMGEDRAYDHALATEDLGYSPEPFEMGLKREIEQYLARKMAYKQSL